jgi:2-keto-4-pentenoate hydratase/2-oxohepta-3-ene-1,7-dioic acid hydratase in catechol pathway
MKIIGIEQCVNTFSSLHDYSYCTYPDSAIIRNNDNFYIPNFSSSIEMIAGIYLQIAKIGKHVQPQFCHRYYNKYGFAINFIAKDLAQTLQSKGVSTDAAKGFDHSFAMSNVLLDTQQQPVEHANIVLRYNSQSFNISLQNSITSIHEHIAQASTFFTYKIGDIFFIPCITLPFTANIQDTIEAYINNNHMIHCTIL